MLLQAKANARFPFVDSLGIVIEPDNLADLGRLVMLRQTQNGTSDSSFVGWIGEFPLA